MNLRVFIDEKQDIDVLFRLFSKQLLLRHYYRVFLIIVLVLRVRSVLLISEHAKIALVRILAPSLIWSVFENVYALHAFYLRFYHLAKSNANFIIAFSEILAD